MLSGLPGREPVLKGYDFDVDEPGEVTGAVCPRKNEGVG